MLSCRYWLAAASAIAVVLAAGCGAEAPPPPAAKVEVADTVYSGGSILTMAGETPFYVESLAVRGGLIVMTGTRAEVAKLVGPATRQVDLGGKALLPGFIDAHSHLLNHADSLVQANLNPPPLGPVRTIPDILAELRRLKDETRSDDATWLIGQGYDQDQLAERRHPAAADLDAAFPANPVVLLHASGHMLVANSAALRAVNITADTVAPPGGTILRRKGSKQPAGLIQETAMTPFLTALKGSRALDSSLELIRRSVAHYASHGITTAAEHLVMPPQMPLLEAAADRGLFTIDLVAAPAYMMATELIGTGKLRWGEYRKGLKYAGIKLALDGSPQGKTAFLSEPYQTPVPGCRRDCRGFPSLSRDDLQALLLLAYRNGVQVFAHANGDAAIDMLIAGHREVEKTLAEVRADRRTVVIHSQIVRPDQLDSFHALGLLPSFFSNHVFYWGDVHVANLGTQRGHFISPLKAAFARGLRATNHTDATVTPVDPLFLLWTSVNRLSRSGKVVGEDQRVTPYEGLLALTIHGAHEYFEEETKGTLEPGKLADLVILDRDPLKVDAAAIRDIRVLETVKRGRTIYRAD